MNIKRLGLGIAVLTVSMISFMNTAHAEDLPFDVIPILPENQVKDIDNYIYIDNSDSKSIDQNLEFSIINVSSEGQKVYVESVNAYTSPNGGVQYTDKESENSIISDKDYILNNHLKYAETIDLKANETKTISVPMHIQNLSGTLLGGLRFSTVDEAESKKIEKGTSINIENKINMIIGVMVDFEKDPEQKAEFSIGDSYIDSMPSYFSVRLPMELKTANLQSNTELDYNVKDKDGKSIFSGKKSLNFAPMTRVNVSIPFESDEIEDGAEYEVSGSFKDSDGNVQEFGSKFVYVMDKESSTTVKPTNLKTPVVKKDQSMLFLVIIVVVVAVNAALITYFTVSKIKNNKNKA